MTIFITGGAGFIGSNFIHYWFNNTDEKIINLDLLTYASNLSNLKKFRNDPRYIFIKGDINNKKLIKNILNEYTPRALINFAAESHVDRSITDPLLFAKTNILGTMVLLNAFKKIWENNWDDRLFYHVSTDEVYGTLGDSGLFTETTPYDPNSPYSASKASSDHFVRSYGETYNMPYVISNCSNNYGAFQFPEKLIPLFINNIINNKALPVYGDGNYTRDWLFVVDHAAAIDLVMHRGKFNETYNIGGFNEWKNIDLVKLLCNQMDLKLGREQGTSEKLITFVKDRAGHDLRYAIDANKINKELGWKPSVTFEVGLSKTIDWYLSNKKWLENTTSGKYLEYYNKMYNH